MEQHFIVLIFKHWFFVHFFQPLATYCTPDLKLKNKIFLLFWRKLGVKRGGGEGGNYKNTFFCLLTAMVWLKNMFL